MNEDTLHETPEVKEAVRRLPKHLAEERQYRITRALYLTMRHEILPEKEWTSYDTVFIICMLYNCLEWYKWVLTNLYHDRQLYNTLIPLWHESPALGIRISRLSGSVS